MDKTYIQMPKVNKKELKKKGTKRKNIGKQYEYNFTQNVFSNFCTALLTLLYLLPLMTGQAYLTIAAVVRVLGYIIYAYNHRRFLVHFSSYVGMNLP